MRLATACAFALVLAGCDQLPGTKAHSVRQAEDLVAYQLLDPSSAQFRDVDVFGDAVCGQVNGKNRLGGYVGFRDFYVVNDQAFIEPEEDVLGDDAEKLAASNAHGQFVGEYVINCNQTVNRR